MHILYLIMAEHQYILNFYKYMKKDVYLNFVQYIEIYLKVTHIVGNSISCMRTIT